MTDETVSRGYAERSAPDALPAPVKFVDHLSELAARKLGVPGWRWCRSELVGEKPNHSFLLTGGVPRPLKRGPRKGRPTWDGVVLTRIVLTGDEVQAEVDRVKETA